MNRLLYVAVALLCSHDVYAEGTLRIDVQGQDGSPLPCRIHLANEAGEPVRAPQLPFWKDHFVCPGGVDLELPAGRYRFEVERGPEYHRVSSNVEVMDGQSRTVSVRPRRLIDMAARGWWSGELHIHRAIEEVPLHLQAEDLHVGPTITWWNGRNLWNDRAIPEQLVTKVDGNRYFSVMSGEDEREGGALMYYHLAKPLPLSGGKGTHPEFPSPMSFVEEARKESGVWIDVEKPFWWDVPVWLASGKIDSIGLANNHMCRSRMYENEAWGKPRDERRLPAPRGNGLWTQELYYHILNSGLRIPPSAGSASGVLPNPVGYNRVYVHLDKPLTWQNWWQGLKAGNSFVTNGPLLECKVNDQHAGYVFRNADSDLLRLKLDIHIASNDHVPAIEVIWNGEVVKKIHLVKAIKMSLTESLEVRKSGWLLVRAITDRKETFRFASTAPWYVEIGSEPRHISKRSAQFFADWVEERMQRVPLKLKKPERLADVLKPHEEAREFWNARVVMANAP